MPEVLGRLDKVSVTVGRLLDDEAHSCLLDCCLAVLAVTALQHTKLRATKRVH